MQSRHKHIYHSRRHLAVTLFVVVFPFLFLFAFSRLAHIAATQLFIDITVSVLRLFAAYFIAVALAWVGAVVFARGWPSHVALPVFDVLQSVPTFAALPLAAAVWGRLNGTVITFLVLALVWPIFFTLVSALKLVKRDWEDAARIFGLKGRNYVKMFLIPVTIPALITGSIIGLGEGWEALVATEIIVGSRAGVGEFFTRFVSSSGITLFGILGLLVCIFSINKLIWLPLLEWSHRRMEE